MRTSILFASLMLALAAAPCSANPVREASKAASAGLSEVAQGSGVIVQGSAHTLGAAGGLVVAAVKPVGESVVLVLQSTAQGVSNVAEVSVQVGSAAVGGTSLAVGSAVTAVVAGTGWALYQGGKLIAYIPNQVGQTLLKREKVS